jgi:hypothetical protein
LYSTATSKEKEVAPTYRVETLRQLAAAGSNFHKDLLEQFNRFGGLTVNQIKHIEERPVQYTRPEIMPGSAHGAPRVQPVTTPAPRVDVSEIEKAFATARLGGIKSPRLRLDNFEFYPAPATHANKGAVYVNNHSGRYLGMVTRGSFVAKVGSGMDNRTKEEIIAAVNDPHAAAVAFGKRFGRCSVCARTLTNQESIDLGIGPICRGRMGWGK